MPLDHRERSPSLSSIVGMYRPPSSAKNSNSQSQMACHFYYDYSEDFDKPTLKDIGTEKQPIAEARSSHGDVGYMDDFNPGAIAMANVGLGAVQDERLSHGAHNEDTKLTPTMVAEKSPRNGENNRYNQVISRLGEVPALRHLSRSAPPSSQQLKQRALRDEEETQEELASLGDSPRSKLLRLSKTLAGISDKTSARPDGNDTKRSSEQTLPDFASIFGSFDLLDRSPYFKSTASLAKALDAPGDARSIHSADHAGYARHLHDLSSTETTSSEELVDESGFSLRHSAQGKKLDILSPEPISPVRGLKVKNSIPQLMKALPPLPSKLSQYVQNAADNPVSKDSEHAEHAEQSVADEAYCDDDAMQNGPRRMAKRVAARTSPSKFRVRVKPSTSEMRTPPTGASQSGNSAHSGIVSQDPAAQANKKPKLKIKISRGQLGQGHCTAGGALSSAIRLKHCNSLAELALYSSKPLKTTDSVDDCGDLDSEDCHQISDAIHDELPTQSTSTSPQPSDPFNIPYPSSSDGNAINNSSIASSNKDTLVSRPSCSTDDTSLHHENGGLRKKMSMFRLRLVESFSANAAKKDEKAGDLSHSESHISIIMASKGSDTNMTALANHTHRRNRAKPDWVAARVKRWAMDAKRAVRSYVRRTLDRSPRRNE
ncbi:hypothetical protein E4U32_000789 [Claviceps aff. humidiphila group G2b]|nr:hypothetical protein E4U32_000789 [Claviceps aff. humidiphila group G2b]